MENNNEEVKTVHSQPRGKNKKLIAAVSVVVVLLIAGAVYLTVTLLNQNANNAKKTAAAKPKLVAPAKVMTSLKSANTATKAAYDAHSSAQAAFNEQPVRLTQ